MTGFLFLAMGTSLFAKDKLPKTVVRAWVIPSEIGLADTVEVKDTAFLNFPMRNDLYDHSICNIFNGNLVSPVISAIYFKRTQKTDFLFGSQYDIYTPTAQDVRFFNTTTPYSWISYNRGFKTYHEDNDLRALFTGNITPRFNIGFNMNYLNAVGHYTNQAGKTFNGTVFTSYNGNHYSLQAAFAWNRLSNFENGGLKDPNDISNTEFQTEDIPVNLEAMSGYRHMAGYLNHYYSFCIERDETVHYRERDQRGRWVELDSIRTIYVPVLTIRHIFEANEQTRRYIEHARQTQFYDSCFNNPHIYRNPLTTKDSAALLTLRNTLSFTFEEAFNNKLKFGATVFATQESQRYIFGIGSNNYNPELIGLNQEANDILNKSINLMADNSYGYTWKNSMLIGGELYKRGGKYIRYRFGGNICLLGHKIGQFKVYGHVNAGFKLGKDSLTIDANVSFRNQTPDYYLQHYLSNHYRWDNNFKKSYYFHVGGQVAYPTKWVTPRVKVDYENISRQIYFHADSLAPVQMESGKSVSILSVDATLNITTPWINLDNTVVWQYSSSYTMPLPDVALYSNLYYHGTWFKALDAQIGVDLSYNTLYYSPILNPALGQFCVQNRQKVGNSPILGAYVNFYVRLLHLRFFAHYQHFNTTFMTRNYFTMPGYPLNPDVFRAGLAFHFYK